MNESRCGAAEPDKNVGVARSGTFGLEGRNKEQAGVGIVAACVALVRQEIAEIAAVRSSPRIKREEEKE
jgi:hypothetical protein